MEVVLPRAQTSPDFNFSSGNGAALNFPYASAPSSPRPFGNPEDCFDFYTSAPASPSRLAAAYSFLGARSIDDQHEFEFGLGPKVQDRFRAADEIFDKGRIKPSRPKPSSLLPPKSPRGGERDLVSNKNETGPLPPSRGDGQPLEGQKAAASSPSTSTSGSRKWRLKDLLLFRSASEGRATGRGSKDPLRKFTLLSSSFNKGTSQGADQNSTKSRSNSTKRGPISAHERHYTANRAAAEEQKKMTPLPFNRNGLFGCLHFNPAVRSIARGFNGYSFGQARS